MPYNNAPIEPPEEVTGSSVLPLARVKKIIAMDEDVAQCSSTAAFAISIATEEFIRYLAEQSHNVVKSERKPRRNIAYKDIATAISRIDNLEFLSDTVPKTKTYRQFREEKAQEAAAKAASSAAATANGVNGDGGSVSIEAMMKNQQQNGVNGVNGSSNDISGSPMAHRSAHSRKHSHPDPIRDIEMTD
ncbi:hypothetical protein LTR99_008984 [Exophiala xenobiotica]|uniref:Transcription factor CBF/NF-Y/archaeal histone domain-containing protein n=1 Tax=Vermiconidia calcicola TaxID=1690605 RepID=A0AAV9Q1Q9_9PEZI|nr:hypothetical protein H2202_007948 [Exophiala xenobiotica]KAK5532252.1 hypothetical protein LTR25_007784 [Vermiconidia calcicola]KAK5533595.1 hypothetical protein LTR23_009166 [Chaetothyriales sp. CCFEE 6169]KAK5200188.1 hypothetical protein LTR92_000730 [Exophiala xenobiotica]KAK5204043.1 hypothetical protein LTR41_010254 [Exophiala xenobiotica]